MCSSDLGGYAMAKLYPHWGIIGPWSAAAVLIIFLAFAMWWRWRSNAWQRIDIFRHETGDAPTDSQETPELARA